MKIPISQPAFGRNAKKYLNDCIDTGWVSSSGKYVEKFERKFAQFVGKKYAVATNSGTSSLHLALAALKIKPEDQVIVPTLTMIATLLPVIYQGATPVLVESEYETGNIDVIKIEKKITNKTAAIIVVDLHGHPVDMTGVLKLAKKYHLPVLEDAAEAHGARYYFKNKWVKTGQLSDISCYSFYGNKIITTGEGGIALTDSKELADRMRSLRNLARSPTQHFLHQEIAFAYRMSNLQAALGVSQLEDVNKFVKRKREVARLYNELLKDIPYLELPTEKSYAQSVFWQYGILVNKKSPIQRNKLEKILAKNSIETRRFFLPMHLQPALKKLGLFKNEHYPVAEDLSQRGLCLPSGLALKNHEIEYVSKIVHKVFDL